MLIKDFLEMLSDWNKKGGVYCEIYESGEYIFQGVSNDMSEELMQKKFTKWDMLGNIFIFICQ